MSGSIKTGVGIGSWLFAVASVGVKNTKGLSGCSVNNEEPQKPRTYGSHFEIMSFVKCGFLP